MNLTQKLNRFRKILETTMTEAQTDSVEAETRSLIKRFEELFPEKIFSDEIDYLRELTYRYCFKERNQCPICGAPVLQNHQRAGMKTRFMGCSEFPKCRGARSFNGSPTINDAMREFLAEKIREEHIHEDIASSRFKELDL